MSKTKKKKKGGGTVVALLLVAIILAATSAFLWMSYKANTPEEPAIAAT